MFIGIGGSGKKTISKIAALLEEVKTKTINISKLYNLTNFRSDMFIIMKEVGLSLKRICFIMDDS